MNRRSRAGAAFHPQLISFALEECGRSAPEDVDVPPFAAGLVEARAHLIHRLSTRHGLAFDSRRHADPRIFLSHRLSSCH